MSKIIKGIRVNEEKVKELLEKGGAYSAKEAIEKSIEQNIPYRIVKLEEERKLKENEE